MIVPNTDLITNRVTNWTLTDRQARSVIPVGVAYGSDIALVMQTLQACALAHPGVLHSPEPQVLFRRFGDSSLDFELRAWVADVDTRLQVASDLHQDIDRRFRQAGIEIPFPQRDLHVRSVEQTNSLAARVQGHEASEKARAPCSGARAARLHMLLTAEPWPLRRRGREGLDNQWLPMSRTHNERGSKVLGRRPWQTPRAGTAGVPTPGSVPSPGRVVPVCAWCCSRSP